MTYGAFLSRRCVDSSGRVPNPLDLGKVTCNIWDDDISLLEVN